MQPFEVIIVKPNPKDSYLIVSTLLLGMCVGRGWHVHLGHLGALANHVRTLYGGPSATRDSSISYPLLHAHPVSSLYVLDAWPRQRIAIRT